MRGIVGDDEEDGDEDPRNLGELSTRNVDPDAAGGAWRQKSLELEGRELRDSIRSWGFDAVMLVHDMGDSTGSGFTLARWKDFFAATERLAPIGAGDATDHEFAFDFVGVGNEAKLGGASLLSEMPEGDEVAGYRRG